MKKLIKLTAVSAAAVLLSAVAFGQTTPAAPAPAATAPSTTPAPATTPAPQTTTPTTTTTVTPAPVTTTVTKTTTMPNKTTKVTVVKTKKTEPAGYKVCYMPTTRHIARTHWVRRCGPFGNCRDIRVSREMDVVVYKDCHMEKYSCSRSYKKFGWYETRSEAKEAVSRCEHTVSSSSTNPQEWKMSF